MKRTMFKKAKSSFLGRTLRRLFGEETGAVMMEYIVVALMIAAACVVAVAAFGTTITGMFGSLGTSMTGDHKTADTQHKKVQENNATNFGAANDYNQAKHSDDPTTEAGSLKGFGDQ